MNGMLGDDRLFSIELKNNISNVILSEVVEEKIDGIKGGTKKVLQGEGAISKPLLLDEGVEDYEYGGETGDGDHE